MKKLSTHDLDKGDVVSSILTSIAENNINWEAEQETDEEGEEE